MVAGLVKSAPIPQPIQLPPGGWTPDVPIPTNQGFVSALNLVPKSNGLYGPERGPVEFFTSSIAAFSNTQKVHGRLHSQTSITGSAPRFYVGTLGTGAGDSKLISREEQGAWSDLSRSGGYTTTASQPWEFANFGARVCACNRGEPLQLSEGGASLFGDVPNSPQFTSIATVAGFLMGVNYLDTEFGGGSQPFGVAWSAIGNPSLPISADVPDGGWPDPSTDFAATVQSGTFPLVGGGELRQIIAGIGGSAAIIVADRKMWRVNYVGPPQVFQFDEIQTDQGATAAGTIAGLNGQFFFLGHNGFYFFDGQRATPIGQGEVDEFFDADISLSATFGRQRAMSAAIDQINKNYVVSYRNGDAGDGRNNRILRYNWLTQRWSNSEQDVDALGSLDNQTSRTDAPQLFGLSHDFQIVRFIGDTLEATMETGETYDLSGAFTEVAYFLPFVDTNEVTAALLVRDQVSQTQFATSARGFNDHGVIPFDIDNTSGRFYACRVTIPAAAEWTNWQGGIYGAYPVGFGSRSGQGGA